MKSSFILAVFLMFMLVALGDARKPHVARNLQHAPSVKKTKGYRFNEGQFGNRCVTDWNCDGLRRCSQWGWCN